VHWPKRSNFRRNTFELKIQLLVFTKNLAKQLMLDAKSILKFGDPQGNTLRGKIITYIGVGVGDVSWGFAYEAKASEVTLLALDLLILLWDGGVLTGEVKVTQGSTCLGHDLLELLLLLLLVPEAVLLPVVALGARVILVVVVVAVLVGGVELLALGAVGDEVGGVATFEAAPRWSPSLLVKTCARFGTSSPAGWSHHRGCSHTAHQKLRSKKTRKTPKQMWQWWRQGKLQSRWGSGVGGVRIMATNMSTSNKSLTSKRSIRIMTTLPR
jgi:hypothetical protein